MPVCSGGWIPSVTVPVLDGSYTYNLEVTRLAERLGFDFTLSQAVWRGSVSPSRHFLVNLESLTTSAGLGASSDSIGVWSTINTSMLHPAIAAKMVSTIDQISHGRTGLNIVAGGNRASEDQMGLYLSLDNESKYRRAREWVQVVKQLWTQDSVSFDGEYFHLTDCQSFPKPQQPLPRMICAATSDIGLRFTAEELDGSLIEGTSRDAMIDVGLRAKRIANEAGRELKTYCVFMIIPGETDADAQRRIDYYNDGRDLEALNRGLAEQTKYAHDKDLAAQRHAEFEKTLAVSTGTIHGSPETIAERLADLIEAAQFDSAVFIMPDFIDDLRVIGEEIIPLLAANGIVGATHSQMQPAGL